MGVTEYLSYFEWLTEKINNGASVFNLFWGEGPVLWVDRLFLSDLLVGFGFLEPASDQLVPYELFRIVFAEIGQRLSFCNLLQSSPVALDFF